MDEEKTARFRKSGTGPAAVGVRRRGSMVILEYEYEVFPDGGRFVAASFEFGVVAIGES